MSIKKTVIDITASVITSLPYTKTSSRIVDKLLIESEKITPKKIERTDNEIF
jgi:hypothetical protein